MLSRVRFLPRPKTLPTTRITDALRGLYLVQSAQGEEYVKPQSCDVYQVLSDLSLPLTR